MGDAVDVSGGLGAELRAELGTVTLEEFRLTEARYETDARLGRELLFLLSNAEWCRRTTEVVDVGRVSSVETRVVVDVDTSYVVHEALRTVAGTLWLPLFTLPGDVYDPGYGDGEELEPPIGVEITDANGTRVAAVPQAEIRRQLAAALADTLVSRLQRWWADRSRRPPADPAGTAAGGSAGSDRWSRYRREHQVLLAAVLTQVLSRPSRRPPGGGPGLRDRDSATRLGAARGQLLQWIADEGRPGPEPVESVLASREAEVVAALRGNTFVVVPAAFGPPTSYTVRTPTRDLTPSDHWDSASVAELQVAVLAPTTHADRVIEVLLPEGVRLRDGDPEAVVEVTPLPQFGQLEHLILQILAEDREFWPRKQLAELAATKLEAVLQALLHHYDTFSGPTCTTASVRKALEALLEPLDRLGVLQEPGTAGTDPAGTDPAGTDPAGTDPAGTDPGADPAADDPEHWARRLAATWSAARPQLAGLTAPADGTAPAPTLRRRIARDAANPDSVRFRVEAIEEFTLRAQPTTAYVRLVLEPRPSPVLGTARSVNLVNLAVLGLTTVFLLVVPLGSDNDSRAEVLAALLTFFPAIQASRLRQPDSTRLAGLLTMRHFTAGLATALPGLVLAGALAFEPSGWWPRIAALVALAGQLACQLLIRDLRRPEAHRWWRPWRPRRLGLRTVRSPDHRRFDVLRTSWCRSLTGDVLLVSRTAHSYLVVDDGSADTFAGLLSGSQGPVVDAPPAPPRVGDRLRWALDAAVTRREANGQPAAAEPAAPAPNLVGVLRGISVDRSVTFLVFRDPPQPGWLDSTEGGRSVIPLDLERGQLAPMEPPDWVIDVMIGFVPDSGPVADHPLSRLAKAAETARFTLLNLQMPAPPLQGERDLRWLRARIGVPVRPADPLDRLATFFTDLNALKAGGIRVHVREVPPTESLDATQTAPEDTFDAPPGLRARAADPPPGAELLTDRALLVPAEPDARWRLVVVCARPQSGLLHAVLTELPRAGQVSSLAAVISGVLNGVSVVFALCRTEGDAAGGPIAADLTAALEKWSALVTVPPGVRAGTSPARDPRALLRLQIHTPDRAGVLQEILRTLGRRIARAADASPEPPVDVLYTLMPVVDGHAISGRMLVRLPEHPAGPAGWDKEDWPEVGRSVARAVTRNGGTPLADAERTSRRSDDTMVTVSLVRRPAPDPGSRGEPPAPPAAAEPPAPSGATPAAG